MPHQEPNKAPIEHWIIQHTPKSGRVLDIGCGEGDLLAHLKQQRDVRGTGIELSETCVVKAVERGLSVHHGNAEEGMDHYSDGTFDLVVMSLALQEMGEPLRMLQEAFRIGNQVLIVFPNFGHWRNRWQMAIGGRAPRTPNFPHAWYDSPNRHFFTIRDWNCLWKRQQWKIVNQGFLAGGRPVCCWPNLLAEVAMYLLERR